MGEARVYVQEEKFYFLIDVFALLLSDLVPSWGAKSGLTAASERPKSGHEPLKSDLRVAKSGQERPKSGQERPKSSPRAAKSLPRAPKSSQRAAKSGQELIENIRKLWNCASLFCN